MPKMTLLEMTQDILSDMDGDEVNSISDTVESQQVATTIRTTYFNIMDEMDLPHNGSLFQLTASGDPDKPTHMSLPERVSKVLWVRYDVSESGKSVNYREIEWMAPDEFVLYVSSRDGGEDTVDTIEDDSGVKLLIRNDQAPHYYTTFDDETLVFDSYNSDEDTTLQNSKTMCHGYKEPTWTHSDSFTPDLPANMFSLLLNEAKSMCFVNLKQSANEKVEQYAKRQRIRSQRNKWRNNVSRSTVNYGRK